MYENIGRHTYLSRTSYPDQDNIHTKQNKTMASCLHVLLVSTILVLFQYAACLSSLPKIVNPVTNRLITLGGETYNNLLQEGRYVQHNGTLCEIDFEALDSNPDYESRDDASTRNPTTSTTDEWFVVTPQIVNTDDGGNKPLTSKVPTKIRQDLLFVQKPSGLHCVPPRDVSQPSLDVLVQEQYPTAKLCHRLDFDTSGVVLFGLTLEAHAVISQQFEKRTTSKTYLALINGCPTQDSGTIDLPIGKIKTPEGYHRWVCGGGDDKEHPNLIKPRQAVTNWRIKQRRPLHNTSLVELFPQTGRGHQLRLHMKAIGHPILGDNLHAPPSIARCSPRLCLHAQRLEVDWNGHRIFAESVPPF